MEKLKWKRVRVFSRYFQSMRKCYGIQISQRMWKREVSEEPVSLQSGIIRF